MDERRIDRMARMLASGFGRRGVAGGLATVLLGGSASPRSVLAACKKEGQKCDKNQDCCDHAECRGDKCRCKNGFRECGGKCYDFDKDEKHCGSCNTTCAAAETCCDGDCVDTATNVANCGSCGHDCGETESCEGGVCITADGCPVGADSCSDEPDVFCPGGPNCRCSRSVEGDTICGDVATPGATCGQCQSSADCASFGAGAFCVATGSVNCCGPDLQNVCRLRCAA